MVTLLHGLGNRACGARLGLSVLSFSWPERGRTGTSAPKDGGVRALYFTELHERARVTAVQQKVPIVVATATGHAAQSIVEPARQHHFG